MKFLLKTHKLGRGQSSDCTAHEPEDASCRFSDNRYPVGSPEWPRVELTSLSLSLLNWNRAMEHMCIYFTRMPIGSEWVSIFINNHLHPCDLREGLKISGQGTTGAPLCRRQVQRGSQALRGESRGSSILNSQAKRGTKLPLQLWSGAPGLSSPELFFHLVHINPSFRDKLWGEKKKVYSQRENSLGC